MKWVTRERLKIDRIACPWLIRRFIEADAEFIYVPDDRVFAVAGETGATPDDIPGAEPFSHDGELCSFDAFIKQAAGNQLTALARIPTSRGARTSLFVPEVDRLFLAVRAGLRGSDASIQVYRPTP
jgi:hypothetical protein